MFRSLVRAAAAAGAVGLLAMSAQPANATIFTSLAGDIDCFGLGGSCADGLGYRDDLGGTFSDNFATAGDPSGQDAWDSFDTVSFNLGYAGGAATTATVDMRIAGVADQVRGPYDMFFNGVSVGVIPTNLDSNAFQEVLTHSFVVPVALLHAHNTFSFTATDAGDGWDLDYVRLTVDGAERSGAPEPGVWALLIGGFAGVGAMARRRRTLLA